jgi:hypothetical protein
MNEKACVQRYRLFLFSAEIRFLSSVYAAVAPTFSDEPLLFAVSVVAAGVESVFLGGVSEELSAGASLLWLPPFTLPDLAAPLRLSVT